MDRRCFLKRLFLIAVSTKLPLLGGCSTSVDPLVLAIHPWVGYETLYLAREFKWLPDVEEVQQVLAGVTMPTLAANRGYLLGPDSRLISAARSLSSMMVRYGLLTQEDNLAGLIMPDTLPSGDY